MAEQTQNTELVELTADIVAAYVRSNNVVAGDLPALISDVSTAINEAAAKSALPYEEELTPAVSIRKSVSPNSITCLECGKPFKSMKRHLRDHHDLTPDEYRERWSLRYDYPMVAANYAAERSKLAKKIGLGRKRA